jgi:hypothetical protein
VKSFLGFGEFVAVLLGCVGGTLREVEIKELFKALAGSTLGFLLEMVLDRFQQRTLALSRI